MSNNASNLIGKGFESRTTEEQREIARKGGIESGKSRARKRDIRNALEMLLEREYKDKAGRIVTGTEAIATKLFDQAMRGNVRAFETLRDTVGQKPVEKIMIADVDQSVIDEVERMVFDVNDKKTSD